MPACKSTTKSGAPCRAAAGPNGLCYLHANPDKVRSLGQAGGRKNRSISPEPVRPVELGAAGVRDILVQAIYDIRLKKIAARTASALSQLCNSLCRVLPIVELEARLTRLEQRLAEQGDRQSATPDTVSASGGEGVNDNNDEQANERAQGPEGELSNDGNR